MVQTHAFLQNLLNEVLRGFSVDYGRDMHIRREELVALEDKLRSPRTSSLLTAEDAHMLVRAEILCEREMDETEFRTRLGMPASEARQLLDRLPVQRRTHGVA